MNIFKNAVTLRGFLGSDAEAPASHGIGHQSFAVLTLCVESGVWRIATTEWVPQTARHTVICPGPFFCGFTRGMKQGEYVEVEGELRRTSSNCCWSLCQTLQHCGGSSICAGRAMT